MLLHMLRQTKQNHILAKSDWPVSLGRGYYVLSALGWRAFWIWMTTRWKLVLQQVSVKWRGSMTNLTRVKVSFRPVEKNRRLL